MAAAASSREVRFVEEADVQSYDESSRGGDLTSETESGGVLRHVELLEAVASKVMMDIRKLFRV